MPTITTETFGNVLVAHTPDDLTEETAEAFQNALRENLDAGQVRIVLQMDRTDSYDSVGLTSLLDLQDEVRRMGGQVKVSGLVDPGVKIFELARLDRKFDIFESVIDAVGSFQ